MSTHKSRSGKRFLILLVGGVFVVLAGVIFIAVSGAGIEKKYRQFEVAESAYEEAAYKPGAEENPVRQQVNMLLSQVIQAPMSPQERIIKAQEGITRLNDVEEQIDDIKTRGDSVGPLLETLEKQSHSPGNVQHRTQIASLITLAKRQAQIIGDIRGLSYRADYYTTEVFERIIDDQGEMTDAHKLYLNGQIPQLEEQFNKRTNLYTELESNRGKMDELAREIGYSSTE